MNHTPKGFILGVQSYEERADEGRETNARSPDDTMSSKSGGTPGGTMAGDRLKTLTELLANVARLSNEELTKLLNAARRVEADYIIADD